MPSFSDLVEETLGLLRSWTADQEQVCTLVNAIGTTDLTFGVDQPGQLGIGAVQIDDELLYVSSVDNVGNATVPAWGRGRDGSTAANHPVGVKVTTTPRYPRFRAKRYINESVTALFPELWAVKLDETLVADPTIVEYAFPDGLLRWVMEIRWKTPSVPITWIPVKHWRFDTRADPTQFPTGVALFVGDVMPPGVTIKTKYAVEPAAMVNDTDDFAGVTGLDPGVADLVQMAAASRMVQATDLSRTQMSTMEASERSTVVPASAAMSASKFLATQYQQRVAMEKRRLLARHPSRFRYEGI